jgi:hypothetical protein
MGKAPGVYQESNEGAGEIAPHSMDRRMGALRQRSNQCQKKENGLSSAVALTLHPLNTYERFILQRDRIDWDDACHPGQSG